jgi:phage baseplate assembly protein W
MAKIFSNEDTNLSTSIRVVKDRAYSDLDLTLSAKTSEFGYNVSDTGDVLKKTDAAAVKQSIKNLLLTNRYEKPFRPNYGGDLGSMLFELQDGDTAQEIISKVKSAVSQYEPRAKILGVKVFSSPDQNSISVEIEFRIVQTGEIELLKVRTNEIAPAIPYLEPTVLPVQLNDILLSEDSDRLLTLSGLYIRIDIGDEGALLTQNEEPILAQNGLYIEI